MKSIYYSLMSLLALMLSFAGVSAQSTDPLVYTVGNVYKESATGKNIAYILWQPGDAATTFGKRFAIYRKAGAANAVGDYQLLGITQIQKSPAVTQSLLKLGGRFDANASQVSPRINVLYAETMNEDGGAADVTRHEPGMAEAKHLSYLINIAAQDKKVLERIFFLGRSHPGIYMVLGHGYAIETPSGEFTYEVRLVDALGKTIRVIGRVTLDAATPPVLVAPTRPVTVPHKPKLAQQEVASPLDNLVARFRWGMSPEHRRMFPHTFGYNLYRVKKSVAEAKGWNVAPPQAEEMEELVADSLNNDNPDGARVNTLPVMVAKIMSGAEAEDLVGDAETFFIHDDKDPPAHPFTNGETYYYFAAARDIAGHPGPLSPGTQVVMCDRIPPVAPQIISITNVYESTGDPADLEHLKGNQHLRIKIKQTPEVPVRNAATRYKIYRWETPVQHVQLGGDPTSHLVGTINHVPGATYVEWDDDGQGAPQVTPGDESQFGKTWWYTVRAEDDAACDPKNLSGHSPPAFGVLRDRAGPPRPSGTLGYCRYLPVTSYTKTSLTEKGAFQLENDFYGLVVQGHRVNHYIGSFDVELWRVEEKVPFYKTHRVFPDALDSLNVVIPLIDDGSGTAIQIKVRCQTVTGISSDWITRIETPAASAESNVKVANFVFNTVKKCRPIEDPLGDPPPHDVISPTGVISGPLMTVTIPDGSAEYRIYRRVGLDGDFETLKRGSAADLPNPLPGDIEFEDPAPPTEAGVEVCYFIQVFDENGNAGARVKIGCVTISNPDFPTPMLSQATYLGESNRRGQIQLEWFCDPVGVERFEIWAASSTSADPGLESSQIGPQLDTYAAGMINPDLGDLVFVGYQTQTVASGQIGKSAKYSVLLSVPAGQTLTFAVRAVGKGAYQTADPDHARAHGAFSNTIEATWTPPVDKPQGVIPWPALAVPGVADVGFSVLHYQKGEGPFYAKALPQGDTHASAILVGAFAGLNPDVDSFSKGSDPKDFFFRFRKQNVFPVPAGSGESILPFVVYRYQLPSALYPDAVPNLIQVSPLIDRVTYGSVSGAYRIKDPFLRVVSFNAESQDRELSKVPVDGLFSRDQPLTIGRARDFASTVPYLTGKRYFVWWVDSMPVATGAKYQYLLVHFSKRGEIDRVIPTNYIQH